MNDERDLDDIDMISENSNPPVVIPPSIP